MQNAKKEKSGDFERCGSIISERIAYNLFCSELLCIISSLWRGVWLVLPALDHLLPPPGGGHHARVPLLHCEGCQGTDRNANIMGCLGLV